METLAILSAGTIASAGSFAYFRYKVSDPDQYLVRTGWGIKDIAVSKTGFHWPLQKYQFLSMKPKTYSFELHAMSKEKLSFILPGVFTIGPQDDPESIEKYARYLMHREDSFLGSSWGSLFGGKKEGQSNDPQGTQANSHMDALVRGMIEGETRVLAAQMEIEELFNNRTKFKEDIVEKVSEELKQFGLKIFNANIKELEDAPGCAYFRLMAQKIKSETEAYARSETAGANRKAEVAEKQFNTESRIKVAQLESESIRAENQAKEEIARSNAQIGEIEWESKRRIQMAEVEARQATEIRNTELQRELEEKKVLQETEKQRIEHLAKARAEAEAKVKKSEGEGNALRIRAEAELYEKQQQAKVEFAKAEADLYKEQKKSEAIQVRASADLQVGQRNAEMDLYKEQKHAEAIQVRAGADLHAGQRNAEMDLYKEQKQAEAMQARANADLYAGQKRAEVDFYADQKRAEAQYLLADAELYTEQKRAEAQLILYESQAKGLASLIQSFQGDTDALIRYLMLEKDQPVRIAQECAKAVQGLQPKITVWNTSSEGTHSSPVRSALRDIVPGLDTVYDQTGLKPGAFFVDGFTSKQPTMKD